MSEKIPVSRRNVLRGVAAAGIAGAGGLAMTGGAAASANLDIDIDKTTVSNDEGDVSFVGVDLSKTINWDGFDIPLKYIGFKHEITLVNTTVDQDTEWHQLYPAPNAGDQNGFAVSAELPDWSNYGDDERVIHYTGDKTKGTEGTAVAGIEWEVINDTGEPGSYAAFGYDGGGPQDPAQWADALSVREDLESADNTKTRTVRWRTTLRFYQGIKNEEYVQIPEDDGVPEVIGEGEFDVTVTNEVGDTTNSESSGPSVAE